MMKLPNTGLVLTLLAAVLGLVLVLSQMKGPQRYYVELGQLGEGSTQLTNVTVQSPSRHAWFVGVSVVVENGKLESDQDIEIRVQKHGTEVFSKRFLGSELIQSDPVGRDYFVLFLTQDNPRVSLARELGYGAVFQLSAKVHNPRNSQLKLTCRFLDDRLIKWF